jgi:uncharacterized protein YxjI
MKEDTGGWLRNQYLFHPHQNVEEGRQQEIAIIIPKFTFLKAKLYASVHNIASRSRNLLVLKGDRYTRSSASIYIGEPKQGGQAVARIVRNITGNHCSMFGKQQTYQLVVEPGVDAAIMVALCIAFDERKNHLRRKKPINNSTE